LSHKALCLETVDPFSLLLPELLPNLLIASFQKSHLRILPRAIKSGRRVALHCVGDVRV